MVKLRLVMALAYRRSLVASVCSVLCSVALAQTDSTVAYLSLHPREMDGHLVRIRARFEAGWEGDNWLVDAPRAGVEKQDSKHSREDLDLLRSPLPEAGLRPCFRCLRLQRSWGSRGHVHWVLSLRTG